jgi:Ca2+-binding RTX toxin-like protein
MFDKGRRSRPRRVFSVTVAVFLALFFVPPGLAATASVDDGQGSYVAAAGETNHVTITSARHIIDSGATITPGEGCVAVTAHEVVCDVSWSEGFIVLVGDLNDFASVADVPPQTCCEPPFVAGGDGDDVILGSDGEDDFFGGAGDDILWGGPALHGVCVLCGANSLGGGPGNDVLLGGPDFDLLSGNEGGDVLSGGAGRDTVRYVSAQGVHVTLDGRPGDGEPGENDNVLRDVENIWGTEADDWLVGSGYANKIEGWGGHDMLVGHGGNDRLVGLGGRDILRAGHGRDHVYGGRGSDTLRTRDGEHDRGSGGPGDDRGRVDRRRDRIRSLETSF